MNVADDLRQLADKIEKTPEPEITPGMLIEHNQRGVVKRWIIAEPLMHRISRLTDDDGRYLLCNTPSPWMDWTNATLLGHPIMVMSEPYTFGIAMRYEFGDDRSWVDTLLSAKEAGL